MKQSHQFSTHLQMIAIAILVNACTLDFDEFKAYTVIKPDVKKDMDPIEPSVDMVIDMEIKDQAVDMMLIDGDGDGVFDHLDNCPMIANMDQLDTDMDGAGDLCDDDLDGDSINNDQDNCPNLANMDQLNTDFDLKGDPCDDDDDNDLILDVEEGNRNLNPLSPDSDQDAVIDQSDLCPKHVDTGLNLDMDMLDNACDSDDDGDGVADWLDNCPWTANPMQEISATKPLWGSACENDYDGDALPNDTDTCALYPNPNNATCPSSLYYWGFQQQIYDLDLSALTFTDENAQNITLDALWMATNGGVGLYFNGQWAFMGRDIQLNHNLFKKVVFDRYQRLWAISHDGTLNVLRPSSSDYAHWFATAISFEQTEVSEINDIAIKQKDEIWLATTTGVYVVSAMGATQLNDALKDQNVYSIAYQDLGQEKNIWVNTSSIVAYYQDQNLSQLPALDPTIYGKISHLKTDSSGQSIWVFTKADEALPAPAPVAVAQIDSQKNITKTINGLSATDVTARSNGVYFATPLGSVWHDENGRTYRESSYSYVKADLKAIQSNSDLETYVASDEGVVRVNAVWNQVPFSTSYCVYDSVQLNGLEDLIIATDLGAYRVSAAGLATDIVELYNDQQQKQKIYHIYKQVLDQGGEALYRIWFGTDSGLSVFEYSLANPNGSWVHFKNPNANYTLPNGAIKYIHISNQRIWVGSNNGLAYATLNNNLDQIRFNLQNITPPYYINNDTRHISHYQSKVYISTGSGVSVFDEDTTQFIDRFDSTDGLPSNSITLAYSDGNLLMIGTELGFWGQSGNQARQIKRGAGLPSETESNHSISAILTDSGFWAMMKGNNQQGGTGSMIYFPKDRLLSAISLNNNPQDYAATRYASTAVNVPFTNVIDASPVIGSKLAWDPSLNQIHVNTCGSDQSKGGVAILDGSELITKPLRQAGLIGSSQYANLVNVHGKIWFSADDGQEHFILSELSSSQEEPIKSVISDKTPISKSGIMQCESYLKAMAPYAYCIFNNKKTGIYQLNAQNENLRWVLDGSEILVNYQINDLAIEQSLLDPNAAFPVFASDRGLLQIRGAQLVLTNKVTSNNVLPSENITAVKINGSLIFVGTEKGLARASIVNQNLSDWQDLSKSNPVKINDIRVQSDSTVWVASDNALMSIKGEEISVYGFAQGLISAPIYQVEVLEIPNQPVMVYTLTGSGISAFSPDTKTWIHYPKNWGFPMANDVKSTRLFKDDQNRLWIQGVDGVVLFTPPTQQ